MFSFRRSLPASSRKTGVDTSYDFLAAGCSRNQMPRNRLRLPGESRIAHPADGLARKKPGATLARDGAAGGPTRSLGASTFHA